MNAAAKIRIATHIEVEWLRDRTAITTCPNCGFAGEVRQYLDIDYRPPDAVHRFIRQICPVCGAHFVDNPETMDYASDELIEIGWHVYQTQLGAGIWPITAPLTRIAKPAAAKVLEIGGAYGFGLDFCLRGRQWQGEGFDPSPLSDYGARELGLTIHQDYFEEKDLGRGPYDVIMATEVIEHLPQPAEFFTLMRRATADDGILLLTTPDAEWITPSLPASSLMPLLSPGAHLVLQTAHSLRQALRAAGFAHVDVRRESMSLVAYASATPFTLNDGFAAGRAMYRRYLVERGLVSAPGSDLCLGFAGRALFEAANDGDFAAAEAAWAILQTAVQSRFGIDLETVDALPSGALGADLAALGRAIPLGLGMILFGRAMQRIANGAPRPELLQKFRLAGAAIDALQDALAQRSLRDGLSASIASVIEIEIPLCQAEMGDPAALPTLLQWTASHPENALVPWRGFVAFVNGGDIAAATTLQKACGLDFPAEDLPADVRRDALRTLANFALAPGGDTMRALDYAAALTAAGEPEGRPEQILLEAFTRLVNASRYKEALAVADRHDLGRLSSLVGGKTARDARLARAVLDLAAGDPAEIPDRLKDLDIPVAQRETLLLEAFIRLVNAARFDEATSYAVDHEVSDLAARHGGKAGLDAAVALTVLDLSTGDPAEVPNRMQGLEIPDAQREALLLEAFIRLANASRYQEAEAYAAAHDVPGLAGRRGGKVAVDAMVAMAVVDLGFGNPAAVPSRLAFPGIEPARGNALLLGAFTGLVNEARYNEAQAIADEHALWPAIETAPGKAAADARIAAVMLDFQSCRTEAAVRRVIAMMATARGQAASVLDGLYVDGFVRLVNEEAFVTARSLSAQRGVERRLAQCDTNLRYDALAALLILELQPGGATTRIPQLVDFAGAQHLPEARLTELTLAAFVTLVNGGDHQNAGLLLHLVEPALRRLRPPYAESDRNALFAAGVMALYGQDDPKKAGALFARLRDALVKLKPAGTPPDHLFWPALRGEIVALQRQKRGEEATLLLRDFTTSYAGAPADLLEQLT